MRPLTKYSMRLACALLLALSGCSLDIQRLYGSSDGGPDAPFDAGPFDGGDFDGGNFDGGGFDAGADGGVPEDAPVSPFALSERDSFTVDGTASSVAAARANAETLIAVSTREGGSTRLLGVTGAGCGLSFVMGMSYPYPGPVAVGQVDRMRGPDAVIGAAFGVSTVVAGTEVTSSAGTLDPATLAAIHIGNFGADPTPDVILVGSDASAVGLGDGTGRFGSYINGSSTSGIVDGAVGDVDLDGSLDLVRIDATRVIVTRGNGTGFFGPIFSSPSDPPTRVTVGDIDENRFILAVGGPRLTALSWADSGDLAASSWDVATLAGDVVIANVDGLGSAEVVVSDQAGAVIHVLEWPGLAVLESHRVTPTGPTELAVVNADGVGGDEILVLVGNQVRLLSAGCP